MMLPAPTPQFQLAATIPVIGDAAYRNARLKLQRTLAALAVRETERAQAVAEFSLLYRALRSGDRIDVNLIGQHDRVELSLLCSSIPENAGRLCLQLHLFSQDAQHSPAEPLRLQRWLRTTAEMDLERAREWLLGTTAEELKLRATQTEEANAAKREFLSRMSHELRTPMNAIIGMTHLALRTDLDSRQRDYLEKIRSAGQNLLGIVNDVLDFSKIEAGKLSLENTDFRLDKILGDVTDLVAERIVSKGVELLFSVDEKVPDELNGDPLRLTQILLNLLSNAAKFTETGQITLRVSLVDRSSAQVELQFEVQDTGIGMTESQMATLFQAFSQADVSTTRRYGGTGLGLSICQRLLELMDGSITVMSRPGEGSCFRARARFGLGQRHAGQVMPLQLNRLRVLVVDDNPVACEVMVNLLAHLPMRQQTASTGEQALLLVHEAALEGDPFGLILLDWQLGAGIDGLEVARRIRQEAAIDPPRIVLIKTHGIDEGDQVLASVDVDAVLSKPVRPSELVDTLVGLFAAESQPAPGPLLPGQRTDSEADAESWNLQGVRVLLVEDNPINQQIACELLEIVGVEVATAGNGVEALAWLKAHTSPEAPASSPDQASGAAAQPCDLVLMDLNMPEMDGWECVQRIRRNPTWQDLPVLAMTAHAMQQERERCLALGMQDHITKPIDPDHLYARLRHWSGRSAAAAAQRLTAPQEHSTAPTDDEVLGRLAGFDCQQALRRMAGNRALYLRLLRSLLQSQGDAMGRLERALAQQNLKEAESIVHTVKGVAANLGATALSEVAAELDAALKRGSCPADLKLAFARQLEETLELLRQVLGTAPDAAAIEPDQAAQASPLEPGQQQLLTRLAALLGDSDGDALDLIVAEEHALIRILGSQAYHAIADHLQRFAFPAALAVLRPHLHPQSPSLAPTSQP